jgi:anthranilate synthase component 1
VSTAPQTRAEIVAALKAGRAQTLSATRIGDMETPVSVFLKLGGGAAGAFLLESVQGGEWLGRFSIVGLRPDLIWRVRDGRAELSDGSFADGDFRPDRDPPLQSLRRVIAESAAEIPAHLPPPSAGLFGYLGYDMIRYVERLPDCAPDPLALPEAMIMRPTLVAVFDNLASEITLVTVARPNDAAGGGDPEAAYDAAHARLAEAARLLAKPLAAGAAKGKHVPIEPRSNTTEAEYRAIVDKCKAYTRAGDIFQVVPSQRFSAPLHASPFALYRALRRLNPSPFLFYLNFAGFQIVGSSPEILVRLRDGTVTIRPIAGTRPRGKSPAEDAALEEELLADPKERAEHLMLLDLGRNDVGRVASTKRQSNHGGVHVTQQFAVERYSHVMHIVSNVEGRLRPELDAIDALFAGFPAGTVSGAPKVRAMEIIDEVEKHRRTVYGGGVGYISASGEMDTCIALRTGVVKDGALYVQAGGGVVLDSDPQLELEETQHKARALFRAAEEAWRYD